MKRVVVVAALLGVFALLLATRMVPPAPVAASPAPATASRSPDGGIRAPVRRFEVQAPEPAAPTTPVRTPTAEAYDALAAASKGWALRCPVPAGLSFEVAPPARVAEGVYHTVVHRTKGNTTLTDPASRRPVGFVTWAEGWDGACEVRAVTGTRTIRGTVAFPDGVEPGPARVFACEGEPFMVEPGAGFEAEISEGVDCVLSATLGEDEHHWAHLPLAHDQPGEGLVLTLVPRPPRDPADMVAAIEGFGGQDERFQLWIEEALIAPGLTEQARAELQSLAQQAQQRGERLLEQFEAQLDAVEAPPAP
jgi:hypothetical protein